MQAAFSFRRESTDDWFEMANQYCQNVNSPKDGKTVYIGSDWKTVTSKQFNLVPDVEVDTWWTNLGDPDEEIIRLYHAHGECEQFHSEVKLTWIWSGFHPKSSRPMHGYSNWG